VSSCAEPYSNRSGAAARPLYNKRRANADAVRAVSHMVTKRTQRSGRKASRARVGARRERVPARDSSVVRTA